MISADRKILNAGLKGKFASAIYDSAYEIFH